MSPWAAFVGALLFASQPLLFGHAFINQKDTPFLSAFLLALALGHEAVRRFGSTHRAIPPEAPERSGLWSATIDFDWRALFVRSRVVVLAAAAGAIFFFADVVVLRQGLPALLKAGLAQLISDAYRGQAAGWLNDLFARVAEQASTLPVEAYVGKAGRAVDMVLPPVGAAVGLLLLLLVAARFPRSRRRLFLEARAVSLREAYRSGFALMLVASAIAAGLATSIRIIGPLAMVMVALLYVLEHRGRALIPLAVYASLAALTTVLTWPFLWANPVSRLVESLVFMANHPKMGYVLYMGDVTKGRLLPWHYLPGLMVLQFTESVWLLFLIGSVVALGSLLIGRGRLRFLALLGLWVLVPILPLTLRDRWLYDNFRQFLFVTPPIFLVAALGIEAVFRRVKASSIRWVLVLALLAPAWLPSSVSIRTNTCTTTAWWGAPEGPLTVLNSTIGRLPTKKLSVA
ncbi:MAG: hypothetical protein A2Z17_01680 [Gammaproteobacteria bacterium RBG_16_66_13]|nr:MAG: hypothetical protein A2Z17_01680 [Gammaproteobacteria bacterium RBG_16_66_13]